MEIHRCDQFTIHFNNNNIPNMNSIYPYIILIKPSSLMLSMLSQEIIKK